MSEPGLYELNGPLSVYIHIYYRLMQSIVGEREWASYCNEFTYIFIDILKWFIFCTFWLIFLNMYIP